MKEIRSVKANPHRSSMFSSFPFGRFARGYLVSVFLCLDEVSAQLLTPVRVMNRVVAARGIAHNDARKSWSDRCEEVEVGFGRRSVAVPCSL